MTTQHETLHTEAAGGTPPPPWPLSRPRTRRARGVCMCPYPSGYWGKRRPAHHMQSEHLFNSHMKFTGWPQHYKQAHFIKWCSHEACPHPSPLQSQDRISNSCKTRARKAPLINCRGLLPIRTVPFDFNQAGSTSFWTKQRAFFSAFQCISWYN